MSKTDGPRVAILGAGPIGLESALYARRLGLQATLYERGSIAHSIARWGHVRLFSPFEMNSTPLGRQAILAERKDHVFPANSTCITGKEHIAAYLEPLAASAMVRECLRLDSRVVKVGRHQWLKHDQPGSDKRSTQAFRLLIRDGKGRERVEEAEVVFDCTGTYATHRWMGDGGIPAIGEEAAESQISYALDPILAERRSFYAGKTVMVVGGGYSAATSVANLATLAEEQLDTWIIWLARCQSTQPIGRIPNDPLRERDRLAARANMLATRGDGNVEFHNQTTIEAVESVGPDKGFRITARTAGKSKTWDADRVIANVGYVPDSTIYRELQIHECYATGGLRNLARSHSKHPVTESGRSSPGGPDLLRSPEPNFFILGAKSYGRNSRFLLQSGFDQIRDVFTMVLNKPDLNLYKAVKS